MAVRITGAGVALTVGIIVVTGLVIGGLFWARQAGDQARQDEAVQIAEEQLQNQSDEEVALNEGGSSSEEQNGSESGSSTEGAANGSGQDIPSTGADVSDEATVNELPATGPADASAVFVLALLAFSVASYVQSRRQVQ